MTRALTFPPTASDPRAKPQAGDGLLIRLSEGGYIPDAVLRAGIRVLCRMRLAEERSGSYHARETRFLERLEEWRRGPVALVPEKANEQHYEVPPEFFEQVLGRNLKYSCALWTDGSDDLDRAEEAMLALTCERAGLRNGMRILELGCGWGSLTLWMAARLPASTVLAVSNSAAQRNWIMARARERGLGNVEVVTSDINDFAPPGQFDRVVSVEMFEHVRNHEELLRRIRRWLTPDGALFVHLFCHREYAYPYESKGQSDWMARHFFSGGLMPSYDLLLHYPNALTLASRWWLSGEHYRRTSEAWLARLDARRDAIRELLQKTRPAEDPDRFAQRWRMFFMAVAETFGMDGGQQWGVGHYLLRR